MIGITHLKEYSPDFEKHLFLQISKAEMCVNFHLTKHEDSKFKNVIYVYENIFEIVVKYEGGDDSFFTVRLYSDDEDEVKEYSFVVLVEEGARKMAFSDVCKPITDDDDDGLNISVKPLQGSVCVFTVCITKNE